METVNIPCGSMSGREIVRRNIHFQNPPRIAYNFDYYSDMQFDVSFGDDMIWVMSDLRPNVNGFKKWGTCV